MRAQYCGASAPPENPKPPAASLHGEYRCVEALTWYRAPPSGAETMRPPSIDPHGQLRSRFCGSRTPSFAWIHWLDVP